MVLCAQKNSRGPAAGLPGPAPATPPSGAGQPLPLPAPAADARIGMRVPSLYIKPRVARSGPAHNTRKDGALGGRLAMSDAVANCLTIPIYCGSVLGCVRSLAIERGCGGGIEPRPRVVR